MAIPAREFRLLSPEFRPRQRDNAHVALPRSPRSCARRAVGAKRTYAIHANRVAYPAFSSYVRMNPSACSACGGVSPVASAISISIVRHSAFRARSLSA